MAYTPPVTCASCGLEVFADDRTHAVGDIWHYDCWEDDAVLAEVVARRGSLPRKGAMTLEEIRRELGL